MSNYHQFSEKKINLLKYKERLQNEINWVQHSIEDIKSKLSRKNDFEDYDPDCDTEMLFKPVAVSSMNERHLRRQQSALRIRLHATEELTNLKVLQSEVNVMAEPPALEREPPVLEAGTWREVTAECRIDLVPFLITFYVHHPHRKFAALSYRGLRVTPVKAQHERELRRSVLPGLTRPAHALEVIRNYAAAHRSRRSTLARLAELYGDTLYMELEPECGYRLRCAGALSLHWTLSNEWSPVAPFHHAMKFDFEYLDEPYVKRLMHAHKKLSDPRIETDERTALLTEMMDVCLEARGPTDASDDVASDQELATNRRRRHSILDDDAELPAVKKPKSQGQDTEVMAPPKSVPKKKKPKGKENSGDRDNSKAAEPRGVKRTSVSNAEEVAKKAKANVARESGLAPEKAVPEDGTQAAAVVTEREITVPAEKGAVAKIVEKTKNIPAQKEDTTALKKTKPVAEESNKIKKTTVAEKPRPMDKVIVESNDLSEKTVAAKEAKSAAKANDKKQNTLTKTSVNAVSAEKNKLAVKVSAQGGNVVSMMTENAVTAEKIESAAKDGEKNQHAVVKTTSKLVSAEKTKFATKVRAQNQNVASDKADSTEKNKLASKLSDKNQKVVAKTTSKANSIEKNVLPPKVNEKQQNVVNKVSENLVSVEKTKSATKVNENTKSSAIEDHKNVANTMDKGKVTVAERLNVVEKNQNATGKEITKTVEKTISAVGLSKKANSTPNVESKVKIIDKSKYSEKTEKNVLTKKTSGPFATSIKAKLPQKAEPTVAVSKSVASASEKPENAKTSNSAEKFRKSINKALVDSVKNSNNLQMNNKQPIKSKIPSIVSRSTRVGNTPLSNAPQSAKERVVSKIPQKKYPTHVFSKQNPVRISPRRLPLLKPGLSASVNKLAKPSWTSPRLLKKPERKFITSSDVQVKGK